MGMGISGAAQVGQPSRITEINQAVNESSQINAILLDRLNILGDRLLVIRTPKPQKPCDVDQKIMAQPCKLANDIRQRASEVAQAVSVINTIIEEIEL